MAAQTVDLVLTAGQSQMSGTCGSTNINPPPPAAKEGKVYDFYEGEIVPLVDPDTSAGTDYAAISGSCLPAFGNLYTASSGRPLVVVRAAVGGSALLASNAQATGDWSPTGDLFDNSVARVNAALALFSGFSDAKYPDGFTLGRMFVIWSQGFRDAVGGKNASGVTAPAAPNDTYPSLRDDYADAQTDLLMRWRTAFGDEDLKLFIEKMYTPAQVTDAGQKKRCQVILNAQIQSKDRADHVAIHDNGILWGLQDGATYFDRGFVRTWEIPRLHYNQTGLNDMGQQFAKAVIAEQGLTPPPPPEYVNDAKTSNVSHLLRQIPSIPPLPLVLDKAGTFTFKCPGAVGATVPVDIDMWGASGGSKGGLLAIAGGHGGGGGGTGERLSLSNVPLVGGTEYTIVIGAPGAGVNFNIGGLAGDGGDTIFDSTYSAKGGKGAGNGGARFGGAGGTGGIGSGGTRVPGGAGGTAVAANNSDGAAGGTASGGGTGGAGGTLASPAGKQGLAPSGGPGGGKGNATGAGHGAAGLPGKMIITLHAS